MFDESIFEERDKSDNFSKDNNFSKEELNKLENISKVMNYLINNTPATIIDSEGKEISVLNESLYQSILNNFNTATKNKPIIIKTYKDLCEKLHLNYNAHIRTRENQEQELKNYIKFTKRRKDKAYVITEVYSKEKAIKNKIESDLNNGILFNFYSFLSYYYELTKKSSLIITPTELALAINYIPLYFKKAKDDEEEKRIIARKMDDEVLKANITKKPYLKKVNKDIKEKRKNETEDNQYITKIAEQQLNQAFQYTNSTYKKRISSLLNKLKSSGLFIIQDNILIGTKIISKKERDSNGNKIPTDYEVTKDIINKEDFNIEEAIKRISKLLDFNEDMIKQELEDGELTIEILLRLENEKLHPDHYLHTNKILEEEEIIRYLQINQRIFMTLEVLGMQETISKGKIKEYQKRFNYLIKKELGYDFIYSTYGIIFAENSLDTFIKLYKEKIDIANDLNNSLSVTNKEFVKDLIENKKERKEKEPLQIQDMNRREVNLFYYTSATNKIVKRELDIKDDKVLAYEIKNTWDYVSEKSKNRLQNTKNQKSET